MGERELKHISMWTDGSSIKKISKDGYHGGAGCYLECNGKVKEISIPIEDGTNNISELSACIFGLEALKEKCSVSLYTDSQYSINCATKWLSGWERRGWRTSSGVQVKNLHLIKRLSELCNYHKVDFIWVKGHNGDFGNEKADELATQASASLKQEEADNG